MCDVARRVLVELLGPAEIDDPRDPVRRERAPAFVGQPSDVVRANKSAVARLTSVCERDTSEVPDVQAPLPLQETIHAAVVSAPR